VLGLDSAANSDYESQRRFWNEWDAQYLQGSTIGMEALRRGQTVISLLQSLSLETPRLLELGCGNGWLAERLIAFGPVTGVDIADEAIEEARRRVPGGTFFAGDALSLDLPTGAFDVVIALETFSHVPSQPLFVALMARVLRRGGYLILTTQNRTVYARRKNVRPPAPGQLRRWVTMGELRSMLAPQFHILKAFTIQPAGNVGFLRIINSARINWLLSQVFPRPVLESLKEKCGLGQTLIVVAQRRVDRPAR
jgi:SAM-dependent methyltransferase